MQDLKNLINGQWVSSPSSFDNLEPATAKILCQVPEAGPELVNQAVLAADNAFHGGWKNSGFSERIDLLESIAFQIEKNLDELAELESMDTGKPISLAKSVDIPRARDNFLYFSKAIKTIQNGFHPMDGAYNYTLRKPLGPVALITPWNLPLYLLTWKTAPALAMGNSIVAKPSEMTPLTATKLGEIITDLGAPAGIFNLVHGSGQGSGEHLVKHPKIKAISFTGGTKTGAIVAAQAAPKFKKLSLELGGKNPSIVFDDCDMDAAVEGAKRAAFLNQGQICLCGSRILVQEGIFEEFKNKLAAAAREMKVGNPKESSTNFGSLISKAHQEKVLSYIELAKEEGGTLLTGQEPMDLAGENKNGFFVSPTLVGDLSIKSRCATEEIFGPVATIHPFKDPKQAIEMANCVEYGLAASVWTKDLDKAHLVSKELETGMVWVNTWLLRDLRVPFGGVKNSGVGREGGENSLNFFSDSQNICIKLGQI